MKSKLLTAVALAAGPLLWASGVQAAEITLGTSNPANITFTGNGAGAVSVSAPTLTGPAFYDLDALGTYTFNSFSFTTGVHSVTGDFTPNANSSTMSFTGGDGDSLTETITFTLIQDDTVQPKLFGTGVVTAAAGDAAFLADFHIGTTDQFDFITMPLTPSTTLLALSATTGSASAPISSGEKFPVGVPEPASLTLLGSALVGLGWMGRRRRRVA